MNVKSAPSWINPDSLTELWQERVKLVTDFVNNRGETQTRIEDVLHGLNWSYGISWESIDKTWNCGLICKVKYGRGCYWKARGDGPVFVDY